MAVTLGLYAAFLIVRLFASLVPALAPVLIVFDALAFDPAHAFTRPWSWLTHVLAYPALGFGALIGLAFGLMFLITLGRDAEGLRGSAYLLVAYFAAALGAAALVLLAAGAPGVRSLAYGPWPGVLGLAMALGVQYPDKTIGLFLLGSVRLIYVAAGFVVLSILVNGSFFAAIPEMGGVLAGAAVGFAGRRGMDPSGWLKNLMERRTEKVAARRAPPAAERRRADPERGGRASQREVDRILDKISAQGKGSLTDEELRILEEAARRG